jgi:hypothetical protein
VLSQNEHPKGHFTIQLVFLGSVKTLFLKNLKQGFYMNIHIGKWFWDLKTNSSLRTVSFMLFLGN